MSSNQTTWPKRITTLTRQQLTKVFAGKAYSVPQEMGPLTSCTCNSNCPAIPVNITECRNFGIIPVALCRFSYSWKASDYARVQTILNLSHFQV
jgi:hypothetical protein